MHISMDLRIKDNLGNAPAVAEIDEYDATMVTAPQHPAHKGDGLSHIIHSKIITGMTPFESPHRFHVVTPHCPEQHNRL
jgi:hypothetical protein